MIIKCMNPAVIYARGLPFENKWGRPSATSGVYWLRVAALPTTSLSTRKGLCLTLLLSMTLRASFVFCAMVRGIDSPLGEGLGGGGVGDKRERLGVRSIY